MLVFCGEDYPEAGTATGLKQRGHHIGSGRSEYLVHLSEEDPGFFTKLNGLFQGILADRRQRTVTLFNDRYSMHRVYWHQAADAFYFAAEAKALLAVRPELRRIDPRSLGESLALGCVVREPHALRGHRDPAGRFRLGLRERTARAQGLLFRPAEWENQPLLDDEAFYRELREIFARESAPAISKDPSQSGCP